MFRSTIAEIVREQMTCKIEPLQWWCCRAQCIAKVRAITDFTGGSSCGKQDRDKVGFESIPCLDQVEYSSGSLGKIKAQYSCCGATFHLASRNIESWVAKQNSGTLFDQRCMTGLAPAFANSVLMRASTDHRYGTEYNVDSAAGVKPAGNCVPAAWSFDGLVSPSCNRISITQVMKRANHLNKL